MVDYAAALNISQRNLGQRMAAVGRNGGATVVTMVMGFYFGTEKQKQEDEQGGGG